MTDEIITEANAGLIVAGFAHLLYDRYTRNCGNLNYQGLPCPEWHALTPAIRGHWCAVALESTKILSKESP